MFVIGQGLWSPWYAGSSLENLDKEFGPSRILDSPVSENAITGLAVGAALAGMRPIVFHPRMDFMVLGMDPLINQAANWSYLFAGQAGVPLVVRAVINRGGEQGAQHSQALHSFFLHVPGIKVVMPATPADAKGLLIAAVEDPNPVLYIDDRWLYEETGQVPEEMTSGPHWLGRGAPRGLGRNADRHLLPWRSRRCVPARNWNAKGSCRGDRSAKPEALGPGDRARKCSQDRPRGSGGPGLEDRRAHRRKSRRPSPRKRSTLCERRWNAWLSRMRPHPPAAPKRPPIIRARARLLPLLDGRWRRDRFAGCFRRGPMKQDVRTSDLEEKAMQGASA